MRISWKLLLAAGVLLAIAIGARIAYDANKLRVGMRVLFVGNSFTFVNNLPAVFAALSQDNGFPVETQMLVESGAALADRMADGSAARLLTRQHYDYLVLQERAGGVLCGQHEQGAPDGCEASRRAHHELADLARAHGAQPIVLGTYVPAELAQSLQINERFLAQEVGAIYVPIADKLSRATRELPEMTWLAADGHPGSDLTLLEAVLLYRSIFSAVPKKSALTVHGPIFDISTAIFTLDWTAVHATRNEQVYDATRVTKVVNLATRP
jgi:hypothetical protein